MKQKNKNIYTIKQFRNVLSVKRELGAIYNALRNKQITSSEAKDLTYILKVLLSATQIFWEQKMVGIEEHLEKLGDI
jgi:hypothetical protein